MLRLNARHLRHKNQTQTEHVRGEGPEPWQLSKTPLMFPEKAKTSYGARVRAVTQPWLSRYPLLIQHDAS